MPNLIRNITRIEIEKSFIFYAAAANDNEPTNLFEPLRSNDIVIQFTGSLYTDNDPHLGIPSKAHVALSSNEATFIVGRLLQIIPKETLQRYGIEVNDQSTQNNEYEY